MATVTKRIMAHKRLGLAATPLMNAAQKASASYVAGAPVYIDSNGYLAACTVDTEGSSSASLVKAAASQSIVGFANQAGAGSASDTTAVGFVPALPGVMFKGQLVDSTSSGSAGTLAQTDLGADMGIAKLSADTHYGVDKGVASSRDCVTVVDLIDDVGDSGGQVGFIVRAGWRQLDL